MKNLGQDPAFPQSTEELYYNTVNAGQLPCGMNKRFYAACAAMQGMISNSHPELIMWDEEKVVKYAYGLADELLKQENE